MRACWLRAAVLPELMQAPAAPRHEAVEREDGKDWDAEQMARAQRGSATSERASARRTIEDEPEDGAHCPRRCPMTPAPQSA
jgi:hypothetical protein